MRGSSEQKGKTPNRKEDEIEEEDFDLFGGPKSTKKSNDGDSVARRSTVSINHV